ncbi:D-arabinono-1,4-lactone oxidase [uncultured Pseudoteredinibacter sp.]|uniref:D-arabinono-1,4-lactone oxidase n=1 Tax=uncultured Pseudoteredinibacter sp. TaxID=1641701 RepID=UPI0026083B90|nr:D-arabinono-1,4-lactone oxidase [uncultured Pseudoteredinibacter sp.]
MTNRRQFLSALVATATTAAVNPTISLAVSATSSSDAAPAKKKRRIPWRNWSGSQECFPAARKAPSSVAELQELVTAAPGIVRPVGAGHSFMPLVPTDDTIISLSRLAGVIEHDEQSNTALIWSGTRLGDIGAPLAERGQALINMPDIDEQSLAGAISTATHGTGAGLGCMSSYVDGLQLLTANGELIDCSADNNADIFKAAQVGLGSLGIVTQIRMRNEPLYRLRREAEWMPIEDILAQVDQLADNNRNFEFYYIPFSGMGFTDVHNITEEEPSRTEEMDQNDGANTLKSLRDWLSWSPKLRELILSSYMSSLDKEVVVANSWENYAKERNVRFNEMEYHLPRENLVAAFKEIRAEVENNFPEVFFPFEVRVVKSDDIWLSPFNGRESCSIAVHRFFQEDFKPLYAAVEPILRKYGGRPHWGKLNTLSGADLEKLYPRWNDFKALRQQLDPQDKFLNPYLKGIFS